MFTGLVEAQGVVEKVTSGGVTDLEIRCPFTDLTHGESVACDGVCLTVVEGRGPLFRVQVAPETLRRSTASEWARGTQVNLERALRVGDRLGGHWVQGHVDAVTSVVDAREQGGSTWLSFALPPSLAPFLVEKGSVCVDGVSLTLTEVSSERFSVMLIPETRARTGLGRKGVGARVNLEGDIIGKFVAKMIGARGGLSEAQLRAAGFVSEGV